MVHGTFFGSFCLDRPFWSWQGTNACNFLNTGYYWMLLHDDIWQPWLNSWSRAASEVQAVGCDMVWLKGVPGPWGPCSQRPVADKPWRPWTGRVLDARDRFWGHRRSRFWQPSMCSSCKVQTSLEADKPSWNSKSDRACPPLCIQLPLACHSLDFTRKDITETVPTTTVASGTRTPTRRRTPLIA